MMRKMFVLCIVNFFLIGMMSCTQTEDKKKISLLKTEDVKMALQQASHPLRIAVGGMITPREGFAYYRRLLDYVGKQVGEEIEFIDRENYAEINSLLKDSYIDVAFVCGGPYVDGHEKFGMELLVAPRAYGDTVYYSYILVHKNSPIENLEELRGKTFAFTDPLSNTGKLVPTYMLAKMSETPKTFFKSFYFTYAHDKSIEAVAGGFVDGSAVDSLIWEYSNRTNPEFTSRTKIIKKSLPYGIPPVVVRPDLDERLKEKLRQIFLNMHKDENGREILRGMMIEKFVPVKDSAYDSIRDMKNWIENQKK